MYVLTTLDVRRLAYEIAVKTGVNNPFNETTKMAGKDWLCGCFARHPDLAIKKPQATSIARALGFNKATVNEFFQIYRSVLETAQYTLSRVWNMDETGITNVQRPGKLVATKGARHVAKVTSGERGATCSYSRVCDQCSWLPATNVYFSTEEDGGSFDERGTSGICRLRMVGLMQTCSSNGLNITLRRQMRVRKTKKS